MKFSAEYYAETLFRSDSRYYACGGLVLWFYDRLVRIVRRSRPARLLSAAHDRELGVTRLEFAEDSVLASRRAGQYCWLALDGETCEWHPFTGRSSWILLRKWTYYIQSGAAYHSLGFEDENLGSSPGWWAATVATYCPSRSVELPKFLSLKPCE